MKLKKGSYSTYCFEILFSEKISSDILGRFLLKAFTLVFLMFSFRVSAQEINSIGVPYVQNFSKTTYQSGNQNWSVAKDENGIMYFGNSEGLVVFDGKVWKKYLLPNRLIVRSVAADQKGKIYTGAFGEFGYWKYNHQGKFVYHSLSSQILGKKMPKDEIWKIYIDGQKIYFQSFASIFIYEDHKITEVKAENPFLFLFKIRERYFVEVIGKGLYELVGKQLKFIPSSEILFNTEILTILPFKNDQLLIGTSKNGLFYYDGREIKKWQNDADVFLSKYQLNNGAVILNKYFAFGTILNGVIIIDENGHVLQKINKSSGLQNNTVLSLYTDERQNLWSGLDNGIDRIELNSPLYFYFDKNGNFGTVYSSIVYKDKIYLGTNQGLFYSDWSNVNKEFKPFDFKLISNSQGQVWDLSLLDGELICGHNNGTYKIVGNSIEKISDVKGGWTIKKLSNDPELLIQGTYVGLVVYKKNERGEWSFLHRVEDFGEPSRFVELDNKNQLWVSHAYKGVYRLNLDKEWKKVVSSKNYDEKSGLPTTYNVNIFKLENKILFSSDSGFYVFDDIADKFFSYDHLNKMLGSYASSNRIIKAAEDKYWFINHGKVALADFSKAGNIEIDSTLFTVLQGRMVQQYENISKIADSIYLISVDDGFAIFNNKNNKSLDQPLPKVLIRQVVNTSDRKVEISENGQSNQSIDLPYDDNNLKISYSLPYYQQGKIEYQYLLEGYSEKWSEWSDLTDKEFTNLSRGSYTFKVRAKVNDRLISEAATLNFYVLSPWYTSKGAIIGYVFLAIFVALFLRHLYHLNLKRHQLEIQQKLQKEKEEYLRQESIANEQKIVKLKNEQLQKDLEGKNRELANSAMNLVYKNELLQKIKVGLLELKDSTGKKLSEDQLKRINKVIDEGMIDERDWNLFERSFNEAHENFFKKLKSKHPQLVPNDLKLCAYLRMNMSSKEMASLLNITLRGVEIRRYRLRKKLNLEHDKNLVEFLMEL